VGAEGLCPVGPPRSGETSRPSSRDLWPARSGAGHMVARKARQSRRPEPVQGSGSKSESAPGVCGSSPKNGRGTWLSHKTKTGGSMGGDGIRAHREASMPANVWRDRMT
jgi:hypothetical protein